MEGPRTLRAVRSWQELTEDRDPAPGVHEAMLLTVGAEGYEATTAQRVADRAGISRDRFNRRFGDKEACFAAAYEEAADELCERLLRAGRGGGSWRDGLRAALAELLRFVAEQPLLARALLLEVRASRGEAWVAHQRVVERLVAAIDRARQEPGAVRSVSAMTAGFMAGAIEETICIEIAAGRAAEVERLLPDLAHLVVLNYFGEDEAWLELGSADTAASG